VNCIQWTWIRGAFTSRRSDSSNHSSNPSFDITNSFVSIHKNSFFALNSYFDNITPCTGNMWTRRFKTVGYTQSVLAYSSRCVSSYSSFALSTFLLRSNPTTNPESDWLASFGFLDCPNGQSVNGSAYFTGQADSTNHLAI